MQHRALRRQPVSEGRAHFVAGTAAWFMFLPIPVCNSHGMHMNKANAQETVDATGESDAALKVSDCA